MTHYYSTTEWKKLSIEQKISFYSVERIAQVRNGKIHMVWKAVA